MPACCSSFDHSVERQFDEKKVAEELKRYRSKGPGPTTRLLEDGIARTGPTKGTLLDVGSGIGSLTFGLLERGLTRAIAVDASSAYTDAARAEAERRGRADAIQFVHADFVAIASDLPHATYVTLDRVVCCYPSYEPLLDSAVRHADLCLAVSYPRAMWYVRLGVTLENGQRWLARNPFRTFVHPPARMERMIRQQGFELFSRRETWMWSVDVYRRRQG